MESVNCAVIGANLLPIRWQCVIETNSRVMETIYARRVGFNGIAVESRRFYSITALSGDLLTQQYFSVLFSCCRADRSFFRRDSFSLSLSLSNGETGNAYAHVSRGIKLRRHCSRVLFCPARFHTSRDGRTTTTNGSVVSA